MEEGKQRTKGPSSVLAIHSSSNRAHSSAPLSRSLPSRPANPSLNVPTSTLSPSTSSRPSTGTSSSTPSGVGYGRSTSAFWASTDHVDALSANDVLSEGYRTSSSSSLRRGVGNSRTRLMNARWTSSLDSSAFLAPSQTRFQMPPDMMICRPSSDSIPSSSPPVTPSTAHRRRRRSMKINSILAYSVQSSRQLGNSRSPRWSKARDDRGESRSFSWWFERSM